MIEAGKYDPDAANYKHDQQVTFKCLATHKIKTAAITSKCVNGVFDKTIAVTCLAGK